MVNTDSNMVKINEREAVYIRNAENYFVILASIRAAVLGLSINDTAEAIEKEAMQLRKRAI